MAPVRSTDRFRLLLACALGASLTLTSAPARALRLLDYNVLNYPGSTGASRDSSFRRIIAPLSPDIFVAEEMTSQAGTTEFLNSLNIMEPGEWAAMPFIDGNDTDCALFYKPAKFDVLGQWAFYVDNPILRYIHVYRVRPVGYTSGDTEIRLYAVHLKASQGFETQRANEATVMRDSMNAMPPGTHAFAVGDFNLYTGAEPALTKFLESQTNNIGRLYDPLGFQGIAWQDNVSIQPNWTQSPCKTGDTGCASGASTGGLDDRFDLVLPTYNWNDGQGYELIPSTYIAVGNDGLHHNNSIQDPPTIPEGALYASSLHRVSDHLPVRVDFQVPARMAVDLSPIAFGTVIVGAPQPSRNLAISNPAVPPADALALAFGPPAGFTGPLPTSVAPGASLDATLEMGTGSAFTTSAPLVITSNAPDSSTRNVILTGTVLDHAQASLDSVDLVIGDTLDFGERAAGSFADSMVRVHDRGYNALQARLSLTGAAITGGDGRFTIVGGFNPTLVAGVGATFGIHFDDSGATLDSTYTAQLVFSGVADEPLPGATSQPDLQVDLLARVSSGNPVAVGGEAPPAFSRLYAPIPNPLVSGSTIRFDLARATQARLDIFDLSGRRVARLADRTFDPGRYTARWEGRDDAGARVAPGLYFVRLRAAGIGVETTRLAVVR